MTLNDTAAIETNGPLQADLSSPCTNIKGDADVNVGMAANRVDKHELPKGEVAKHLRRLGLSVRIMPSSSSFDMLVNGEVRVTLRVAYPGMRRHRVTVGGRSYNYRYETWHFNFHHHGRLEDRYTDFFVCIAMNPKLEGGDRVFVIPWDNVTGKTFSLHSGRGDYRGRYAPCLNDWDAIVDAGRDAKSLAAVA